MRMDIAAGHFTDTSILQEPMGYVDGANLYQFVRGDPVDKNDPSGLTTASCDSEERVDEVVKATKPKWVDDKKKQVTFKIEVRKMMVTVVDGKRTHARVASADDGVKDNPTTQDATFSVPPDYTGTPEDFVKDYVTPYLPAWWFTPTDNGLKGLDDVDHFYSNDIERAINPRPTTKPAK